MATTRLSAARSMVMINMIAVMSLDSLEARCSAGKKDVQTTRKLVGHLGRWPDRPLYRPLYRSRAGAIGRQEVRHEGHSRNLPPPRSAHPRVCRPHTPNLPPARAKRLRTGGDTPGIRTVFDQSLCNSPA